MTGQDGSLGKGETRRAGAESGPRPRARGRRSQSESRRVRETGGEEREATDGGARPGAGRAKRQTNNSPSKQRHATRRRRSDGAGHRGAPPTVASGRRSMVYLCLAMYMMGTPGICKGGFAAVLGRLGRVRGGSGGVAGLGCAASRGWREGRRGRAVSLWFPVGSAPSGVPTDGKCKVATKFGWQQEDSGIVHRLQPRFARALIVRARAGLAKFFLITVLSQ